MTAGYLGLFIASFLSATILPFSSEALLCGMIIGGFDPYISLIVATVGNWLGSMSTFLLGYWGDWNRIERWLKIDRNKTEKYIEKARRWGYWAGMLVWVPVVGDIICVALGLVRTNVFRTSVTIFVGKFVRYFVIVYLTAMGYEIMSHC